VGRGGGGEREREDQLPDTASLPQEMANREELESLSSKELHDRALSEAAKHLDVGFFWRLFEALPAAEAAVGQRDEAEQDVTTLRGRLNDLTHSGEGELADALRPLYVDYLATRG
jgi:hypothetical protein